MSHLPLAILREALLGDLPRLVFVFARNDTDSDATVDIHWQRFFQAVRYRLWVLHGSRMQGPRGLHSCFRGTREENAGLEFLYQRRRHFQILHPIELPLKTDRCTTI